MYKLIGAYTGVGESTLSPTYRGETVQVDRGGYRGCKWLGVNTEVYKLIGGGYRGVQVGMGWTQGCACV